MTQFDAMILAYIIGECDKAMQTISANLVEMGVTNIDEEVRAMQDGVLHNRVLQAEKR